MKHFMQAPGSLTTVGDYAQIQSEAELANRVLDDMFRNVEAIAVDAKLDGAPPAHISAATQVLRRLSWHRVGRASDPDCWQHLFIIPDRALSPKTIDVQKDGTIDLDWLVSEILYCAEMNRRSEASDSIDATGDEQAND